MDTSNGHRSHENGHVVPRDAAGEAAAVEDFHAPPAGFTGVEESLKPVDVYNMGKATRKSLVAAALHTEDQDHEEFLQRVKDRMDAVHIKPTSVEVRFQNVTVEASIFLGGRSMPSVGNAYLNLIESIVGLTGLLKNQKHRFVILDNVSGTIKPGRLTLLLGPPGAGKSTLLKTLADKMRNEGCKITGNITYNGKGFDEFVPQRTSAYVEQTDLHLPELTVRETMDFAARVQGVGHRPEELAELRAAEAAAGQRPDPLTDPLLDAETVLGKRESIRTDYMLKLLGLEICSDTIVGNAMMRGVSGGQRKRVTTAELVVAPKKTLFLDEISTGLDSSTTYQITKALRDMCHLQQATILTALLQPQPESYDLFDDVLLMAEGSIIYHGPRTEIVAFFESCGFKCPERKAMPDFLQEITSEKDQGQYWAGGSEYRFIPVLEFADAFDKSVLGRARAEDLATPFNKEAAAAGSIDPLIYTRYALRGMAVVKACLHREWLLVQRNSFVYVFKAVQISIVAIITSTLFLRTHIHHKTYEDANLLAGFLFFTTLQLFFIGIAEMTFTIQRLGVFFRQRDNLMFPAWAFVLPGTLMRLPIGLVESLAWTVFTYFETGLTLDAGRVFMFWLLCFLVHQNAVTIFRMIGALARSLVVANAAGALFLLTLIMLSGFTLPKDFIHPWWIWAYWIDPIAYAQRSLIINEFSAGNWQAVPAPDGSPGGLGVYLLQQKSFKTEYWWVWLGVGVLFFTLILFNLGIIFAHTFLPPVGNTAAVMTEEALADREYVRRGDAAGLQGVNGKAYTAVPVDGDAPKGSQRSSRRASRSGKSAKQLAAARSKRLAELSQRQINHSRNSLDPAANEQGSQKQVGTDSERRSSGRSLNLTDPNIESGMVLPFEPMIMTFRGVHYYVDLPPAMADLKLPTIKEMEGKKVLELLCGISGAFRPGVLTALMGVSGAGKTTLMDVLAGRKTGGIIEGDIRINGHPKTQDTFARVSGYCEQFDIHSPQTNVVEALLFSAKLRINGDIDRETLEAYVDEVMDLVELSAIRGVIVGQPGVSGLSVEQRKRLTIAVELVANPSIIFMDEPTSGLDARAAAIVMRAVRNIVNTGRTIVCTIHQPSIDIFESFDELLLLKRGGRTIYAGPLGKHSADLVGYFSAIANVPPIRTGINPATWMLEVTTPGTEERIGVDFADIYEQSSVFQANEAVIEKASTPAEGSEPLAFDTVFPRTFAQQAKICFDKFFVVYWRTPEYNATRFGFSVGVALMFGTIVWKYGANVTTQQHIFNVLGSLYLTSIFLGILNSVFVQPVISAERTVMYRERGAGMYAVMPWYLGLISVELMYLILQGGLYTCVVYFMCGFQRDAGKFFWFMLFIDLTLIYFTTYGITAVAITPNLIAAAVISGAFYGLFNLFAGFVIQEKNIPGWWIWVFWADPVQWTLRGLITSQLGNVETPLVQLTTGGTQTPKEFIFTEFGYESGWMAYNVVVLLAYCTVFIMGAGYALKTKNFQKR